MPAAGKYAAKVLKRVLFFYTEFQGLLWWWNQEENKLISLSVNVYYIIKQTKILLYYHLSVIWADTECFVLFSSIYTNKELM